MDAHRLVCGQCNHEFPFVGAAPILVTDAQEFLAEKAIELQSVLLKWEGLVKKWDDARHNCKSAPRCRLIDKITNAWRRNIGFGQQQLTRFLRVIDARALVTTAARERGATKSSGAARYNAERALEYLWNDWSASAESERQVTEYEGIIFRQANCYCEVGSPALLLGAGVGRHLLDLASIFDCVLGLDLSVTFVDAFHGVAAETVPLSIVTFPYAVFEHDVVRDFDATISIHRENLARIVYGVADAARLPLANESVSTVITVFFLDVIPLKTLIAEVSRVLPVGGRLVNFGPLHYHFNDPADLLTPEDIAMTLEDFGFRFEEQGWHDVPFSESPNRGFRFNTKVWSFVLTKIR